MVMKVKSKKHQAKLASELEELAGDAYHELHSHYPKTALFVASTGSLLPSVVHAGLERPFFKHKKVH